MYIYIYIYYSVGFVHSREMGLQNQNKRAMAKNKMPGSEFYPADKKRKAPASMQGLERSALYAIAARGCIVAKRREQCYNLRGVLLSCLGYDISRICPDSYKARAFRTFRQHWE